MEKSKTSFRVDRVSISEVKRELKTKEKSLKTKIFTLIITLFIFAGAGLLNQNPINLALIVLVLLIHESGHWIGMKLFKYNDVQMFFIPGFGAAVSGTERIPCARQKAIVSLLGPLPGILIGILCIVAYAVTNQSLWAVAADMFLLINSFNLLPITPLDGGRFVEALFFTRHPRAEVGFKVLTTLAMGYLAYQWKSVGLGLLAYISLISIKNIWAIAQSSKALQGEITEVDSCHGNDIPDEWLGKIILSLDGNLSDASRNPKGFAAATKTIWNRIRIRHCSAKTAIGLTIIYLLFLTPYASLLVLNNVAASLQEPQNTTASQELQPALEMPIAQMEHTSTPSNAVSVSGTTWVGTNSKGEYYEYQFNHDNTLYYKSPTGFWKNGTWQQDKSNIYMETNDRFCEYKGKIYDNEMRGNVWNTKGHNWTWVAAKKD